MEFLIHGSILAIFGISSVFFFVSRRFRRYKNVYLSQPVGKDMYALVHFLKESFYSLFNAFSVNPIHNFIILVASTGLVRCLNIRFLVR